MAILPLLLWVAGSCSDGTPTSSEHAVSAVSEQSARASGRKPRKVKDLAVVDAGPSSVTLRFTEVDDGTGSPASYDIRHAIASGEFQWGSAASVAEGSCAVPVEGTAVGNVLDCTVEGLAASTAYELQMVAFRGTMDDDAVYGPLSHVVAAETTAGTPGRVDDLAAGEATDSSVTLTFTQVDDGAGSPASYDIRFALASDDFQWGSAASVAGGTCAVPVEGTAVGETLTCTVQGLDAATGYDFQLVAFRGTMNEDAVYGELSNVASGSTVASIAPLSIETTELVDGTVGASYTDTLTATGGDGAYAWSISSGSLPPGLQLAASAGDITGTPTTAGTYTFEVSVSSGDGQSDAASLSILVADTTTSSSELANECDFAQSEWIWCDDFDADRLASYFEYDDAGGRFVRSGGDGMDGSTAMRAEFQSGTTGAGNLKLAFGRTPTSYMAPVDAGTNDYRDIYWRLYVRNEAGWTGGGGHKLSRATVFASSNWAQAAIGHVWTTDPDHDVLALDPASGTDTSGNLQTTTYNDFSNLRWLGLTPGTTPIFDADHVGQWYCVEARMRLNDPDQENGVFELWIDGVLEARSTGLDWVGSYDDYGINTVMFENYWDDGAPADQVRYIDNIVVSTAPIGCGGASEPTLTQTIQAVSGDGQTAETGSTLPDPLRVQVVDGSSAAVSGATVTWEVTGGGGSLSPTTTTTDADGYAETTWTLGSSEGTNSATASLDDGSSVTFTATAEAPTDTTESESTSTESHEPSGFTHLTERPFSAVDEDGWTIENQDGASIESDVSAPASPSSVLRVTYPAGFQAGYSPVDIEKWTNSHTRNFLSFWIKLSDNFQGETSGTNKILFNWMHNNPSFFLSAEGVGSGTLQPLVRLQNVPDSREYLYPNVVSDAELVRGQWHHWEVLMEANTPGSSNGTVTWWLDGELVGQYTDIQYADSGQSNTWMLLEMSPIWGGVDGVVDETMNFEIDHLYLSGAN